MTAGPHSSNKSRDVSSTVFWIGQKMQGRAVTRADYGAAA